MAVALDRPELEGERGPQGMLGRDHARARQLAARAMRGGVEADEIGDEQEEATESGGEPRGARANSATSAMTSTEGPMRAGRSSSRRRGKRAKPSWP